MDNHLLRNDRTQAERDQDFADDIATSLVETGGELVGAYVYKTIINSDYTSDIDFKARNGQLDQITLARILSRSNCEITRWVEKELLVNSRWRCHREDAQCVTIDIFADIPDPVAMKGASAWFSYNKAGLQCVPDSSGLTCEEKLFKIRTKQISAEYLLRHKDRVYFNHASHTAEAE